MESCSVEVAGIGILESIFVNLTCFEQSLDGTQGCNIAGDIDLFHVIYLFAIK